LLQGVSPFRDTDLSSIRVITNTGGTIPPTVLNELIRLFDKKQFFLNYGLTESYRTSYLPPSLLREKPSSIGYAIPGVDVLIVQEDGTVAPPGVAGEILHRGDYLFLGYWGDPDATARALRPDPLAPKDCPNPSLVLHTGDYGYFDKDGALYYLGRRDRLLKSMGVRVTPGQVEELLYLSELVSEAAVFGKAHDILGHEIWAAIVPKEGVTSVKERISEYSRRVMSEHMLPRRYMIKTELPKTTTGKVDYEQLIRDADDLRFETQSLI
jgi:acyl-CoA synthetase (AMP-forming)/AMP-acid ligase II